MLGENIDRKQLKTLIGNAQDEVNLSTAKGLRVIIEVNEKNEGADFALAKKNYGLMQGIADTEGYNFSYGGKQDSDDESRIYIHLYKPKQ